MSVDPKSKKTYHQPKMGGGLPISKYWAAQTIIGNLLDSDQVFLILPKWVEFSPDQ
jgi:hypothetical protein